MKCIECIICFYSILSLFVITSTATATSIKVPQDQPTIQAGIDASTDGDTVLVDTGRYVENINFNGKNIVVGSLYLTLGDPSLISQTIVDGDTSGSVVKFENSEKSSAILCGFTIYNGMGTWQSDPMAGGGMGLYGGGIFVKGASPTIAYNEIIFNSTRISCSGRGGGIAVKDSSCPRIIGNTIRSNNIIGLCGWDDYFGGGVWIDSTSVPIIGGSQNTGNSIYG
ncbi:MAG: hypothetical protein V3U24_00025, partial [Candidatus Neomarinimicrobiota bacterium]